MSPRALERPPQSLSELMNFREIENSLERTYLNIARAIVITREAMHLDSEQELQVVFLYADGAVLESMAIDMQRQSPDLHLVILAKPFSRKVMNAAAMGSGNGEEWSRAQANELMQKFMIEDDRLGKFNPSLPTLWIDSSVSLSFVKLMDKLFKQVQIGDPAYFFSINALSTVPDESKRFARVFSPSNLSEDIEKDSLSSVDIEAWLRLPIEKSEIPFNEEKREPTLQFSEARNESSAFFPANAWSMGPKYQARRRELLNSAFSQEGYERQIRELTTNDNSSEDSSE